MRELNTQEYNQYKGGLMNLTWFMYSEKEFDEEDEEGYKDSIREELEGSKQEMKYILKIIYTEDTIQGTAQMINKKLEIIHGEINTLLRTSYTPDPDSIEDNFVYKTLETLGIATRHSNSHSRAARKKTTNHKKKSKKRKKSKRRKL